MNGFVFVFTLIKENESVDSRPIAPEPCFFLMEQTTVFDIRRFFLSSFLRVFLLLLLHIHKAIHIYMNIPYMSVIQHILYLMYVRGPGCF